MHDHMTSNHPDHSHFQFESGTSLLKMSYQNLIRPLLDINQKTVLGLALLPLIEAEDCDKPGCFAGPVPESSLRHHKSKPHEEEHCP